MNLRLENRGENWKLDFKSEGWLAQNSTPHGAPAVRKDTQGVNRFELHGDVEERLGLPKEISAAT